MNEHDGDVDLRRRTTVFMEATMEVANVTVITASAEHEETFHTIAWTGLKDAMNDSHKARLTKTEG